MPMYLDGLGEDGMREEQKLTENDRFATCKWKFARETSKAAEGKLPGCVQIKSNEKDSNGTDPIIESGVFWFKPQVN